ncbi:hypothetical protein L2E82_39164 [Cichorium intybus]|uniref:Uncharacterized protein n=1 Tax=Cichorium intybus TaxID=13427 RepID=A0ACB9AGQ6_CICIN|nr:hypothetical protein L2E82_39164 [Cichorium intybus]
MMRFHVIVKSATIRQHSTNNDEWYHSSIKPFLSPLFQPKKIPDFIVSVTSHKFEFKFTAGDRLYKLSGG